MIGSEQRRQRLGAFLKAHRIRLVPQEVGLSATGRRRTPGLRREEVAQLAGISATWYVRIEQGREIAASAATLDRIARALRLAAAEREHTFTLADRHDSTAGTDGGGDDRLASVSNTVKAMTVPASLLVRPLNMRSCNNLITSQRASVCEHAYS